jgi:hypothetical protein
MFRVVLGGLVLALLLSAPPVQAKCAWILWSKFSSSSDGFMKRLWEPDGAFRSVEECNTLISRSMEFRKGDVQNISHYRNIRTALSPQSGMLAYEMTEALTGNRVLLVHRWACYPDTINPNTPTL